MSRIRTIKPEFWVSEQVISCSPLTRLLFIGLWNFCDDNGVHPASYVRLKAEAFPADSFTIDDIKKMIAELISNNLLREYVVDDKAYWMVTGWKKHQRIDKPTYRHPLPISELKALPDSSVTILGRLPEYSNNTSRSLTDNSDKNLREIKDPSPTEWKGMESNGKEKDICEIETSPSDSSEPNQSTNNNVLIIFRHWQEKMNHLKARLDNKRKHKIMQALKLGYSVEQLKQAIDGCNQTPFNMGQNDRGQRYDDIELILRDASHIDRFINNAINPLTRVVKSNGNNPTIDIMSGVL